MYANRELRSEAIANMIFGIGPQEKFVYCKALLLEEVIIKYTNDIIKRMLYSISKAEARPFLLTKEV